MVGDTKITITYEILFELLRNEKNRDELQKLDEDFVKDVHEYLQEKQNLLSSAQAKLDDFSEDDKENAEKQLKNIMRILKELYDKRERKIVTMALYKARTNANIVDTSSLLENERQFFKELTDIFSKYRNNFLHGLSEAKKRKSMKIKIEEEQEEEQEEQEEQEENKTEVKVVRFLHAVPKFMGKELEVYGPFDEEDVASLPIDIADLLIKKGRVEELSED